MPNEITPLYEVDAALIGFMSHLHNLYTLCQVVVCTISYEGEHYTFRTSEITERCLAARLEIYV